MALPEISSAPQLNIATSLSDEYKAGIGGKKYVDAYNQAQMAKYNNEYNYWLWQQQMEYNSPANQVQRLKEAGLNPNFNSIDGTGNATSIPTSSGSITPSIARNHNQQMSNVISLASTLVSAFGAGINAISTLSDVPPLAKIPEYRKLLLDMGKEAFRGKKYANYESLVDGIVKTYMAGGSFTSSEVPELSAFATTHPSLGGTYFEPDKMFQRLKAEADVSLAGQRLKNLGVDFDIKKLVKEAKAYYNKEIQPYEGEKAKGLAGSASFGQLINKVANGEELSWRDVIAAILALAALKL